MILMIIQINLQIPEIPNDTSANVISDYENNTAEMFFSNQHCIEYGDQYSATSKDLYHAYTFWCDSNSLTSLSSNSFINWIRNNEDNLGIRYSKHILQNNGINIRGFKGLKVV